MNRESKYQRPDGTYAETVDEALDAWHAIGDELGEAFGYVMTSFNPGIVLERLRYEKERYSVEASFRINAEQAWLLLGLVRNQKSKLTAEELIKKGRG